MQNVEVDLGEEEKPGPEEKEGPTNSDKGEGKKGTHMKTLAQRQWVGLRYWTH